MNTTLLLSTQRSGTTFFDRRISKMCDFPDQGGEPLSKSFFKKHNCEYLISPTHLSKKENFHQLYENKSFGYYLNDDLLKKIINSSTRPIFNFQYSALKRDPKWVLPLNSPIIHLIRKNQVRKSISEFLMNNQIISPHIKKDQQKIDVTLDKEFIYNKARESLADVRMFCNSLKNKKNVKTLYYEDISNPDYWNKTFVSELEDFMKIKFTNKEYYPTSKKNRDYINILNEKNIDFEKYSFNPDSL